MSAWPISIHVRSEAAHFISMHLSSARRPPAVLIYSRDVYRTRALLDRAVTAMVLTN